MDYSLIVGSAIGSMIQYVLPILALAGTVGIAFAILGKKLKQRKKAKTQEDKRKESYKNGRQKILEMISEGKKVFDATPVLLSDHERNFYDNHLTKKFDKERIFFKVRVVDVIDTSTELRKEARDEVFNTVNKWHFDFVITDDNFRILGAVELDDASHDKEERRERDKVMNAACKNAGVTLYRYRMKKGAFVPV